MIRTPELSARPDVERTHLQRFLETAVAQELTAASAEWRVASWPRMPGYPARFILRNEVFAEVEVTFQDRVRYTVLRRDPPAGIQPLPTTSSTVDSGDVS